MLKIIKYDFLSEILHILIIILISLFLQISIFLLNMNSINLKCDFNAILVSANLNLFFLATIACIIISDLINTLGLFSKTKSLYTYLTLPLSRRKIFFAKLFVRISYLLLFIALEVLLVLIFFSLYAKWEYALNLPGELYLAVNNNFFTKICFIGFSQSAFFNVIFIFISAAMPMCFVILLKSGRYFFSALVVIRQ